MTVTIKIECENEAFNRPTEGEGFEVARILRKAADHAEAHGIQPGCAFGLMDYNGNRVGQLKTTKR